MIKVFLFFAAVTTCFTILSFTRGEKHLKGTWEGKDVYILYCQSCHMENGEGVEGLYPPVAKTKYLKNTKKIIDIILNGQFGEVTVNGKKYNTDMPAQAYLSDEQIADVLTFIRSNWGNKYPPVTPEQVNAQRR